MNIDKIKEDLHIFKNNFNSELNDAEEAEINEFIESLLLDLQNKINKISTKNLTESMKKYIDEINNG